jgi:hypothetical protein
MMWLSVKTLYPYVSSVNEDYGGTIDRDIIFYDEAIILWSLF